MPSRTETPATKHDVLNLALQMTVVARALVANGMLKRADFYTQIADLMPAMDPAMKQELETWKKAIDQWPEPSMQ